jgi:hypothetical protein
LISAHQNDIKKKNFKNIFSKSIKNLKFKRTQFTPRFQTCANLVSVQVDVIALTK